MGFPWYIAKRYFISRHRFGFISTISRISIAGLAIGIAALLLTVSVLSGFRSTLEENIIGFDGHIRLRLFHKTAMSNLPDMTSQLKSFSEVKQFAPYISHEAMIRAGSRTDGVVVEAMPDSALNSLLRVGEYITEGSIEFTEVSGLPSLVVSRRLARKLDTEIGDKITLFSIDGIPGPRNHPRAKQFRLGAIYHTGMSDYDDVFVYTSLAAGQDLFKLPDQAHGMLLMLHNSDLVEPFSVKLQEDLGYPYYPVTWYERHASLFAWLQSQQMPIIIVFGLIAIVAVFNIVSTLMMIVLEKNRDIGILKAMGSSRGKTLRIFVWNGLIIGLLGAVLGTGLGLGLGWLQQEFALIHIPADVYFMSSMPVEFHWEHIVIINGIALILSTLATVYPALQAAKKKPVEAIVHE
ncbi:MAG: ABC transporter permease [Candidatus Marinimicrobia bacterium]|nr:ABC transporter permease [Candidatus Neomarinimicrobiota bacterium]MCF7828973.1 ABC transporter permease [Candidatus Neomarinimicrobiota bacterium]MCF7879933.1 ABC transporter permease [Candidatus Neomarinimicrobiota bacterium]